MTLYYPERNLTKNELEYNLNARLFRTDRKTEKGKSKVVGILKMQEMLDSFTDSMVSENFAIFYWNLKNDIGLKIDLRINDYFAAYYAGTINTIMLTFAELAFEDILKRLDTKLNGNMKNFPHILINLHTGDILYS